MIADPAQRAAPTSATDRVRSAIDMIASTAIGRRRRSGQEAAAAFVDAAPEHHA